jgi:uncharacterized protein YbbC (DUF1343 family)
MKTKTSIRNIIKLLLFALLSTSIPINGKVLPGIDVFIKDGHCLKLKGKNVAVVTNQTGINTHLKFTFQVFEEAAKKNGFTIVAFMAPEHGFFGDAYAGEKQKNKTQKQIPVYSLYGSTRRPTKKMLENVDVIIYDIQDIGSRSYTYITTLCYIMETAGENGITVIVLDRPNPVGGLIVDGPMLEKTIRSFVGYIETPYCHGMTIGELALFFNTIQNKTPCKLEVIRMHGWERWMSFADTGLTWQPTSPHIPEEETPFFYSTTGIIGELQVINIGIGYTLPFKLIGAPWICANNFANALNKQKLKGVVFLPFQFKPFYGKYSGIECQGVRIVITDKKKFHPVQTCYLILTTLKSLYPNQITLALQNLPKERKEMFYKVCGTETVLNLLINEQKPLRKLTSLDQKKRSEFLKIREKFLLY